MPQTTADKGKDAETHRIIGAAMEVHRILGNGFLETVYHHALEHEFNQQNIPYKREYQIPIVYKGHTLGTPYRADFLCHKTIIVELKATTELTDIDYAQLLHYLKATRYKRGLLLNFGSPSLQFRRFVHNQSAHPHDRTRQC